MSPRQLSFILFLSLALPSLADPLTIHTDRLTASCDPASGVWTLASKSAPHPFALEGHFSPTTPRPVVSTSDISDPHFGRGQSLTLADNSGRSDQILLFPSLPFALLRTTLHNAAEEPSVIRSLRLLSCTIDLGRPVSALKCLGTGGLSSLSTADLGSYMWLAVADPATRHGVVAGWISTDRGSGAVFTSAKDDRVQLAAQLDFGHLRLSPGQSETLETFALGSFDDARDGLEAWADLVAKVYDIHLPPQPVNYCTWYHAGASNEKKLAEQITIAAEKLKPFGLQTIQIDDGWQLGEKKNGPKKDFTSFNPKGPYPSGMKPTADRIRAAGFTPGLWFMPFAGTFDDPAFANRQALFFHREDGAPYDTKWGGTCLDLSNPAAQAYLRDIVHRLAVDWGYRYFKMDGLYTGTGSRLQYVNDSYKDDSLGDSTLFDPAFTHIQAYRTGLRLIRQTAGNHAFLLGCCANQNMRSYGGAFGLVDAMRIGPDNGPKWSSLLRGPAFGSRNYHLHGRIWYNDPDPLYVRAAVPINEARAICSWVTISGQLNTSSDAYADLPPERLDLLKRTMPSVGRKPGTEGYDARPVDIFDQPIPRIWMMRASHAGFSSTVLGLFNWSDTELEIARDINDLGLSAQDEWIGFEYWSNSIVGPFKTRISRRIPARSCEVIALRSVQKHPQLLSTSRHITQGIIDVAEVKWDEESRTLSGSSRLVAGDPYELRIAVPAGYATASAGVSAEDQSAGVTTSPITANTGLARVTLQSSVSRSVRWTIPF